MRLDDETDADVSESVTISLLLSAVATALVYFGLWNGSIPVITATALALGVGIGLPAGVLFYRRSRPSASGLDPEGEGRTLR